jgi:hypothetical protein
LDPIARQQINETGAYQTHHEDCPQQAGDLLLLRKPPKDPYPMKVLLCPNPYPVKVLLTTLLT